MNMDMKRLCGVIGLGVVWGVGCGGTIDLAKRNGGAGAGAESAAGWTAVGGANAGAGAPPARGFAGLAGSLAESQAGWPEGEVLGGATGFGGFSGPGGALGRGGESSDGGGLSYCGWNGGSGGAMSCGGGYNEKGGGFNSCGWNGGSGGAVSCGGGYNEKGGGFNDCGWNGGWGGAVGCGGYYEVGGWLNSAGASSLGGASGADGQASFSCLIDDDCVECAAQSDPAISGCYVPCCASTAINGTTCSHHWQTFFATCPNLTCAAECVAKPKPRCVNNQCVHGSASL